VLADTGATRSLISLSTANRHGCEITATSICLSAANGTKIDVSGTTSLQVVDKGKRIHTIVAVVSMNVDQTIIGWKDLMAMGIISPDWPAMPRQEAEGRILAADKDEEEKELAPHTLRRSARVQERKERQSPTVNAIFQTLTPTRGKKRGRRKGQTKEKKKKGRGSSSYQPATLVSTGCAAWPAPICSLVRCSQQFPWDCHSCSQASSPFPCSRTRRKLYKLIFQKAT
jgi:hypothetical protein